MEDDHEEAEENAKWTVVKSRRRIRRGIMAAGSRRACAAKNDREGSVRESKSGRTVAKRVRTVSEEGSSSRMWCEIEAQGHFFRYRVLADTGCDVSILGTEMAQNNGLRVDKGGPCHTLTTANGDCMKVEGTTLIKVRPRVVDGKSNENGQFIEIEAIVSPDMGNDFFLSIGDLKKFGVVDVNFPRARSYNIFQVNKKAEELVDAKVRDKLAELKEKHKDIFG